MSNCQDEFKTVKNICKVYATIRSVPDYIECSISDKYKPASDYVSCKFINNIYYKAMFSHCMVEYVKCKLENGK